MFPEFNNVGNAKFRFNPASTDDKFRSQVLNIGWEVYYILFIAFDIIEIIIFDGWNKVYCHRSSQSSTSIKPSINTDYLQLVAQPSTRSGM